MEKIFPDGNFRWDGGMDASRFPDLIGENQYARACNVMLPRKGGGISVRSGYHNVKIKFGSDHVAREIFETGHIQAEGWFRSGSTDFLVVVVNGYVFRLKEITKYFYDFEIVNRGCPNNQDAEKAYVNRIPDGVIVNDGINSPLVVRADKAFKTSGSDQMGAGLMGVYVQNRYFQVSPDRKSIVASDFLDPISLVESRVYNIQGFMAPEDGDEITAIGRQKSLISYVEVGVLAFSTTDSIYSVDVRGDRGNWEEGGSGTGKIQQSIPSLGAASHYSFESFNTNLFFRTMEYGISDFKQSQYQFVNYGDMADQSIEVNHWLDDDTKWMLDKCYTRGYQSRLYTTIAPSKTDQGYVFWNSMVVMHPNPTYSSGEGSPRRFEGVITGLRPWAVTVSKTVSGEQRMFVWSHDKDKVNRLYLHDKSLKYDVNERGDKIDIEAWIETRGMIHGSSSLTKIPTNRYYKLRDLSRTTEIKVFSRTEATGDWLEYSKKSHLVKRHEGKGLAGVLERSKSKTQGRNQVQLDSEVNNLDNTYSSLSGNSYFMRQDRIEIKGHVILDAFVRMASLQQSDTTSEIETQDLSEEYKEIEDFSYSIATSIHNA